ncbi:MAG: glucosaminidase domain-containing protein [Chryseolinea sp.]
MKRIFPYALLVIGFGSLVLTNIWYETTTFGIRTRTIEVTSLQQIVPVGGRYVKPILYTHVVGLKDVPVDKAKETFIAAVLPAVLVAKHEIDMLKIRLRVIRKRNQWSVEDSALYLSSKKKFRARDLDDLLLRVGSLPTSIVLAQAAVESGWGQSRFFLQANNLFGVWSFDNKEPRIAAGQTRNKRTIYLRSYADMSESIVNYFEILASSHAYSRLRKARIEESDPFKLLPHLSNFSERRYQYTKQLKSVILQNSLTTYDLYQIDPDYLFEE